MTVQELINKLQQVEDKSALIVTPNYDMGYYTTLTVVREFDIPKTLSMDDDCKEDIPTIKSVAIV